MQYQEPHIIKERQTSQLNIAFSHIPSKGWSAGEYYLKNIFVALRSLPPDEVPSITLMVQDGDYQSLQPFVDHVLIRPEFKLNPLFTRLLIRFAEILNYDVKRKNQISTFLKEAGVNALFTIGELGTNFSLPLFSWIPDFQHLHFPDFFPEEEIKRRNSAFKRSARNAKRIIVSSQSSYEDLRSFAPWAINKARVLPFVAQISHETYTNSPEHICSKYNIPKKFILLPNQFWKHKNHQVVAEALKRATPSYPELTIVCTGNTNESRDLTYFGKFLGTISKAGVRNNMILLGLVPRDDLFSLMRQSVAVLQPSMFEGWSSTVEEVKSLGKPLIVSDIPVHREQNAPSARYFSPSDADDLADCLVTTFSSMQAGPNLRMEELARQSLKSRTKEFGSNFLEIVKDAL